MDVHARESCILSRVMDKIGYRRQLVRFRQNTYKNIELAACDKSREYRFYSVYAGSKAEGLTAPLENDFDRMEVPFDVYCTQYPASNREDIKLFELDMTHTTPGYAFLRLLNNCDSVVSDLINDCAVFLSPGQIFLSSDTWRYTLKQACINHSRMPENQGFMSVDRDHGPSITLLYQGTSLDNVSAFACDCPGYLNSWIIRDRFYQWPSPDVIRDVANLKSHVVPVGFEGSPTYFLEWRICFTKAEIKLVQSFNDCLTKVLVLLKEIAKSTLKPICRDMTSYIMKNIIMWIAESYDISTFTESNLIFILQLALKRLRAHIFVNNLPSYTIPERNLLANRLTKEQRTSLCDLIDTLLNEGPRVVLRSQKFRDAFTLLYIRPEEFHAFYKSRENVEIFGLALFCYAVRNVVSPNTTIAQCLRVIFSDDVCKNFVFRIVNAILEGLSEEDFNFYCSRHLVEECIKQLQESNCEFLTRHGFIQYWC